MRKWISMTRIRRYARASEELAGVLQRIAKTPVGMKLIPDAIRANMFMARLLKRVERRGYGPCPLPEPMIQEFIAWERWIHEARKETGPPLRLLPPLQG